MSSSDDFANDRDDGGRRGGRRGGGGGGGKFSKFGRTKVVEPEETLDYKNLEYLTKFIAPTGKIVGRRRTNFSGQNQRKLANEIKRARFLGLLPYVGRA
ncbi:MAG: 30S ribosomal protein S18 [Planctomycetes bacterium]|nr:30S ribosomal protein S18 [Planctomycetota bacterium]